MLVAIHIQTYLSTHIHGADIYQLGRKGAVIDTSIESIFSFRGMYIISIQVEISNDSRHYQITDKPSHQ